MTAAARLGLLLAAAVLLPSCGRHWNDRVHVTVHNDGATSVEVHAEAEYWSRWSWEDRLDWDLSAGETVDFHFHFDDLNRLKIRIYRSSDSSKIFDDFWDRHDLEHLDLRVSITIHP